MLSLRAAGSSAAAPEPQEVFGLDPDGVELCHLPAQVKLRLSVLVEGFDSESLAERLAEHGPRLARHGLHAGRNLDEPNPVAFRQRPPLFVERLQVHRTKTGADVHSQSARTSSVKPGRTGSPETDSGSSSTSTGVCGR